MAVLRHLTSGRDPRSTILTGWLATLVRARPNLEPVIQGLLVAAALAARRTARFDREAQLGQRLV